MSQREWAPLASAAPEASSKSVFVWCLFLCFRSSLSWAYECTWQKACLTRDLGLAILGHRDNVPGKCRVAFLGPRGIDIGYGIIPTYRSSLRRSSGVCGVRHPFYEENGISVPLESLCEQTALLSGDIRRGKVGRTREFLERSEAISRVCGDIRVGQTRQWETIEEL